MGSYLVQILQNKSFLQKQSYTVNFCCESQKIQINKFGLSAV